MDSLLDIQKKIKDLERTVRSTAVALDEISHEIQNIRNTEDDMDIDHDMIRAFASNIPFRKHPISFLKDPNACEIYIEIFLCIMRLDTKGTFVKMVFIQWILNKAPSNTTLQDLYLKSLKLDKNIYPELCQSFNKDYGMYLIVDSLIIANLVGKADPTAIEYIVHLCTVLHMDTQNVKECSMLSKIALCQKIQSICDADIEMILLLIEKHSHYINPKSFGDVFIHQREICLEIYDKDLWLPKDRMDAVQLLLSIDKKEPKHIFRWITNRSKQTRETFLFNNV